MHERNGIALDHLDRMTDSTGLIQHAIYGIPRRESGYTTDDNARALRLCVRMWSQHADERMLSRVTRYLSFLEYARSHEGGFHNFMSYDRRWLDVEGTGDCQGQAARALAEVLGSELPDDHRALARELIEGILPCLADLRSVRAQAYVILAWGHLRAASVKDIELLENIAWFAAQRLVESYHRSLRPDWQWFESCITYANAVLPHALFVAARRWPKGEFLQVAETAFAFLDQATTIDHAFWPIGSNGWYPHGEDRALYDQQPVEAATMADAALAAFEILDDQKYLATFCRAHDWFHGQNSSKRPLIDAQRGACVDGLQANGVNRNQGAESTLAYLCTELQNAEVRRSIFEKHQAAIASA
jgi:uncharacterized protein YyaL (SSP411 family)